jgi:predicted HD phosphohydrolase
MERSPLLDTQWRYTAPRKLDDFTLDDWNLLAAQRPPYQAQLQATQAIRLLSASKDDPSFGYQVNNYRHSIQAATLALADGRSDEYVVAALLHDIGFIACPPTHGVFAARLLEPYVDPAIVWMLERHMYFQAVHYNEHPTADRNVREVWRGHPHFEATAEFVARYDQCTIDPTAAETDLAVFEPIVRRVFATAPRSVPLPP